LCAGLVQTGGRDACQVGFAHQSIEGGKFVLLFGLFIYIKPSRQIPTPFEFPG